GRGGRLPPLDEGGGHDGGGGGPAPGGEAVPRRPTGGAGGAGGLRRFPRAASAGEPEPRVRPARRYRGATSMARISRGPRGSVWRNRAGASPKGSRPSGRTRSSRA